MHIYGHGIDIVENKRIVHMLEQHPESFLSRCYTNKEIEYAQSMQRRYIERLAGRFAVKEAVLKAIGTGWRNGIAWTDMEILPDHLGKPLLIVSGKLAGIADDNSISQWLISLSHTEHYAVGSAIAVVCD